MNLVQSAKRATLIGLIGVSIFIFSIFITFCRMMSYTEDGLSVFIVFLALIGVGGLLTFFIMMFIYYSKQSSNSNQ